MGEGCIRKQEEELSLAAFVPVVSKAARVLSSSPVRMCVILDCHPGPNVRSLSVLVTLVLL